MEATMPSTRITQLVIGIVAAVGMAAVSVSAIGNDAVAQSTVEQTQTSPKGLTNRYEIQSSELDFRLGDHQQLKRMLLDGSRDRLK
jgi:hypothetical protein